MIKLFGSLYLCSVSWETPPSPSPDLGAVPLFQAWERWKQAVTRERRAGELLNTTKMRLSRKMWGRGQQDRGVAFIIWIEGNSFGSNFKYWRAECQWKKMPRCPQAGHVFVTTLSGMNAFEDKQKGYSRRMCETNHQPGDFNKLRWKRVLILLQVINTYNCGVLSTSEIPVNLWCWVLLHCISYISDPKSLFSNSHVA